MKVAITVWNDRISPVFDVARNLLVLDIEKGSITGKRREIFIGDQSSHKASLLAGLKIQTLICGAISQPLAGLIGTYGIKTISFISGDVEDVLAAYLAGKLSHSKFTMPGCRRSRRMRARSRQCRFV